VPDDEDKPAPAARQPEAHAVAAKFEGSGTQSVHAGLAQAAAAKFAGAGNLSAVVERGWFEWHPLVDDITRGRPSPAQLFRDEAQRQLASGELPPTLTLNAFARDLLAWLVREHPNVRPPKSVRVVERYVRKLWRAAGRT
jgi:hypothetical protein